MHITKNEIYNIDCLEGMKYIEDKSIDMILADLPYGLLSKNNEWDKVIPFEPLWEQYERIIKDGGAIVLFGTEPFSSKLRMSNLKLYKYDWVWFKNVPTGMAQSSYAPMKYHENIMVFARGKIGTFNKEMQEREGKGKDCYKYEHYCGENNHVKMDKVKKFYDEKLVNPSSVILFNTVPNRNGKLHPTQKPVELLKYLIRTYTNEGEVVLDNAMGSGSTAVACIETGRDYIGFEIDKGYWEIAVERANKSGDVT